MALLRVLMGGRKMDALSFLTFRGLELYFTIMSLLSFSSSMVGLPWMLFYISSSSFSDKSSASGSESLLPSEMSSSEWCWGSS